MNLTPAPACDSCGRKGGRVAPACLGCGGNLVDVRHWPYIVYVKLFRSVVNDGNM